MFGLRPEHITEAAAARPAPASRFEATLDVVEPMGMETMVYFTDRRPEVAAGSTRRAARARRDPAADANMDQMHLIDPASGAVI